MQDKLLDYVTLRDWIADSGGAAFPTYASLEWFMRRHRKELVESGQLIIRRGSAGSLVGPRFGALVLEIMRRESRGEVAA